MHKKLPFRRHNHILPQKLPQGNLGALKISVISNLATLNSFCPYQLQLPFGKKKQLQSGYY